MHFGRFLEVSIPTADIQASLEFYVRLGLTELETRDVRDYHYTVVTDGRLALGLHAEQISVPSLSFVQPDVAQKLLELEVLGEDIVSQRTGEESFNEATLMAPDRIPLALLEAPSFSLGLLADADAPAIGQVHSLALPARFPESAAKFWLKHGFTEDATPSASNRRVLTPGLVLELDRNLREGDLRLDFWTSDLGPATALVERWQIEAERESSSLNLKAPEGTRISISRIA